MLVTPPPLLYAAFGGDVDRLVYHLQRTSEDAVRTLRAARARPVFGARAIERLHPWSEPRTLRETGGRRVPSFRVGARDILGTETHVAAATETRNFRAEHEQARLARACGDHARRFPFGTYQMRLLHGAPVQPVPKPTALVTAPGPLLCDVQAQLDTMDRATAREQLKPQSFQLLDEVRTAIADEAAELCEHAELDFEQHPAPTSRLRASDAQTQRPALLTRHRFSRDRTDVETGSARRLVVLRDRRRGRPPGDGRHGADPPG